MRMCFLLCALACLSTASLAQEGIATFKNFRHPPPGQYTQTLTGVMNGQSGPPQRQTVCTAGTPDGRTLGTANALAAASGCTTRVLEDTERLAVSEQTCRRGNAVQINRTTLRRVDDRTSTVDTLMRIAGLPDTTSHSTVVYEGPCTAVAKAAQRPSAEECAEFRASMADAGDGAATCAQLPANLQGQCNAQVAAGRRMAESALARCR